MCLFFDSFQVRQLKSKIRLLAPSSSDEVMKIKTAPVLPPKQEPASEPAFSSGQKSSPAAAAAIALKSPRHIHAKHKRIVSRDEDSNFFVTPSPSPSPSLPAANPSPRGDLPILVQDSYRSSLKRTRAAFGNVTNDELWPPKRRKKLAKDNDVSPDVEMSDAACGRVETTKVVSASLPAVASPSGLTTRLRPPVQVNATASSSKVLLPDPPHRPAKPTNLLNVVYAKGTSSSDTSHVHTDAPSLPKAIQDTNLPFNIHKKNHDGRVAGSSTKNPVPIKTVHRLISSPDDDVDLQLARLSVDNDDPFIANKRTTSPVKNFNLPPRRIDLRKSLDAKRTRSHTSTSSISRHSNPPFLLPEDREIFNQVGLPKVMAVIAKNYGFDVDVAMRAFFATKSIKNTKKVLQFAKEVTNSATSTLLAALVNDDDFDSSDDDEDEDEAPQSMWRGHNGSPPSGKEQGALNSGRQKEKRSFGSRKSNRLSIKPRPLDEEIDETALSDYSPPHVSRAGQFLRLVKEGRREEAVDRERRRASGAFVTQTQAQAQGYDEDQQRQPSSSSLMPNNSPTLNSGQEPAADIDTCNVEDSQPLIVAPHDDIVQHHDQPPGEISLPVDDDDDDHHHRIFFKRISEGQSSLNEDEDDPEVLKLAKEHRDLVMNVTEDNADALRSFEQKNNQDLLRLWSLDWVRQKIADMY